MNIKITRHHCFLGVMLGVLLLMSLACGASTPTSEPNVAATVPKAVETQTLVEAATDKPKPTNVPAPTNTPVPTNTLEQTETPVPTDTPEPAYVDPVVLADIEGVGKTVTDNYEWPMCQKAVFYWTASPGSYGSASLIVNLHNVETGRDMPLVNEFSMDVSGEGLNGTSLQPLEGGEYYFTTENTDEAWTLRVECQDGVAPEGTGLDLQGTGNIVTDNYELPACNKSVFVWSTEPGVSGTASLIVYLCKAGEGSCTNLVNEFGMELTEPLEGEALNPLSGGNYFLATQNTSGNPWSIRLECRD